MSNAATGIAWAHTTATTATQKLILIRIADMDGDGGAWPAMKTLAAAAMVTVDAARKAVRQLEDLGEIKTHLNEGGGLRTQKHMRTNVYEFLLRCPWYCDSSASHRDLRDEKNAAFRPVHWPEMLERNTGQTPQPQEQDPAPGTGGPQPQERPNHHLTTHSYGDTPSELTLVDVSENENTSVAHADQFEDWHPGAQVARAAAQVAAAKPVKRPDLSKSAGPIGKVPPAPHYPRFDAARERSQPEPRTPADDAAAIALEGLNCPAGTPRRPGHWLPPRITVCVQCGHSIAELTKEQTA